MASYLGLIKMSTEEASRVVRDGPKTRRDQFAHLVQEANGTLRDAWYTNVGDWDLICIVDMADPSPVTGAAATLARRAAGLTSSERWIELAEINDVADALEEMSTN